MKIPVRAASHSYVVTIGNGILKEVVQSHKALFETADKIIVLTDEFVWAAQREYFEANFSYSFDVLVMPAGEHCKSFENYQATQTFLIEKKLSLIHI